MTRWSRGVVGAVSALALLVVCTASSPAPAAGLGGGDNGMLQPGNPLVSTSVFQNDPNIQVGTPLPPGYGTTSYNTPCVTAVTGGTYPYVFSNASVDGSFGVTRRSSCSSSTPSVAWWGRSRSRPVVPARGARPTRW